MTNWILGEKFNETYPHLSGVKALWETKWKFPVRDKLLLHPSALNEEILIIAVVF